MLKKSAKLANLIQGIGLALYLCSYFSQREAADRAMVHSMGHPSWLPLFSIIFLATAVLTSSVLTLLVLSNKRIDIRGKIVRGYLDLRDSNKTHNVRQLQKVHLSLVHSVLASSRHSSPASPLSAP